MPSPESLHGAKKKATRGAKGVGKAMTGPKKTIDKNNKTRTKATQLDAKKAIAKGKKVKDPSAPKRALTPFNFFCTFPSPSWPCAVHCSVKTYYVLLRYAAAAEREKMKTTNPEIKGTAIMKEIGHRWKALVEAAKEPYNELARQDRLRYDKEKEAHAKEITEE